MKDNVKEIHPDSINYYIEKNLDDFYSKSSDHPNFGTSGKDKVNWVLAKNADWPDCIFKANFENKDLENEIKTVKNLIKNKKAPNGWTVGPLSKPKNLGNILEKFGFSNVYHQAGMAVQLINLKKRQFIENVNFTIQKVENEDTLFQWSNVVSNVFNLKVDFNYLKFMLVQKEAVFCIGSYKEKPVSTLLLYLSSGVAGLHAVSTLSEFRGRGFGLAISRFALEDAFKMGYFIGVLQASSLGERVYKKLGFQKYCDIYSYALIEESEL
ncbi:MAG: GNAT family N-acetyltransferase [Candidatus Hermodarchaeota archaeon]